jgi:sugar/nucleoside kinase (ribokinase family)
MPARCDAVVINAAERVSCAPLLERPRARSARAAGAPVIAVTAGQAATELHLPDGSTSEIDVVPVRSFVDDLGAGDVFAAAFFVALAEGRAPGDAAAFASAAAAVRIAGAGPGAVGDRGAIERALLGNDGPVARPGRGVASARGIGDDRVESA